MFLPKRRLLLSPIFLLPLAACTPDEISTDDSVADASESDEEAVDESEDESDETGEPQVPSAIPALGITIGDVEVNQGTTVIVGRAGEWVGPEDRLGPLVSKRDSLVRIHYTVEPGWVERDIQAQLLVTYADGTSKTLTSIKTVSGDSAPNTLAGAFYFGLVASKGEVEPGMSFQVSLHEVDETNEALARNAGLSESIWQTPSEPSQLGVQSEPLELKIVFVPYHHKWGSIDRVADTSDQTMKIIVDYLYEQNATHNIIYTVHEPVLWEYEMTSLGAVLGPMSAMRENEQAFPNEYYHGLFPIPNGGVAGVAGVAQVPGDGKGEGYSRVSVTALGNSVQDAAGVVVHEVGHNEGLAHVYCPYAEAASPDPTYPYQNGLIGQWGFGIISFRLYPPDANYDYMTYCGPSWLSTWSWNKTFQRIRTLTSWEYEDVGSAEDKTLLIGAMLPDGNQDWWTVHGTLPTQPSVFGDDGQQQLELYAGDQLLAATPSVVRYANDLSTAWVISELPQGLERLDGVDTIVRVDRGTKTNPVPAAAVELSQRDVIAAP